MINGGEGLIFVDLLGEVNVSQFNRSIVREVRLQFFTGFQLFDSTLEAATQLFDSVYKLVSFVSHQLKL
jgi:hypothetical protein